MASSSGAGTPTLGGGQSVLQQDLAGLHLTEEVDEAEQEREREKYREKPGLNMKQEELVAKVRKEEEESGKKGVSLIVVGECTVEDPLHGGLTFRTRRCWEVHADGAVAL